MFKSMSESSSFSLSFTFDDQTIQAEPGMTVAAALFAAGIYAFRTTPVSQSPRGPFCMMGACYDCLVVVDGVTVQACLIKVREGLIVNRVPVIEEVQV